MGLPLEPYEFILHVYKPPQSVSLPFTLPSLLSRNCSMPCHYVDPLLEAMPLPI